MCTIGVWLRLSHRSAGCLRLSGEESHCLPAEFVFFWEIGEAGHSFATVAPRRVVSGGPGAQLRDAFPAHSSCQPDGG
jgi:hypothetical protein